MKKTLFTVVFALAVASFVAIPAARADNITSNQWYSVAFTTDGTPLYGPPYTTATDGPVLPGGFADSVAAPSGTSWTITLSTPGTLTITDLEDSGDQFQMYDNGVLMTAASSPFTAPGQNPGQVSPGSGMTSNPCDSCSYEGEDINAALGDSAFSSGTFALGPGVNVITGTFLGVIGNGDAAFIVEPAATPEPSSLLLLGSGLLGGLGIFRRKLGR